MLQIRRFHKPWRKKRIKRRGIEDYWVVRNLLLWVLQRENCFPFRTKSDSVDHGVMYYFMTFSRNKKTNEWYLSSNATPVELKGNSVCYDAPFFEQTVRFRRRWCGKFNKFHGKNCWRFKSPKNELFMFFFHKWVLTFYRTMQTVKHKNKWAGNVTLQ